METEWVRLLVVYCTENKEKNSKRTLSAMHLQEILNTVDTWREGEGKRIVLQGEEGEYVKSEKCKVSGGAAVGRGR